MLKPVYISPRGNLANNTTGGGESPLGERRESDLNQSLIYRGFQED